MMKALLCGMAALAVPFSPAAAGAFEPHYDHALEKAAAGIVASKIGDIRGGFSFDQKPRLVLLPPAAGDGDQGRATATIEGAAH
jgi:hypothetical protein